MKITSTAAWWRAVSGLSLAAAAKKGLVIASINGFAGFSNGCTFVVFLLGSFAALLMANRADKG